MDQGPDVPQDSHDSQDPQDLPAPFSEPGAERPPWAYPHGPYGTEPFGPTPQMPAAGSKAPTRRRIALRAAIAVGAAAGIAAGVTIIASAATAPAPGSSQPAIAAGSSGSSTTVPSYPGGRFPHAFGPDFGFGFGSQMGGGGGVIYGQYRIKGANGYETIDTRTGTVSSLTDVSGSTWSLVVTSADGTSGTFTVDSQTSVNGGETGISSVNTGDEVEVTALDNDGTATATEIVDKTVLQSNGSSWMPAPPAGPSSTPPSSGSTS